MLNRKKVWTTNTEINIIALIISSAVIIIPVVLLYIFIGKMFWKVLLIIGCCLITIPFAIAYGLGRAGAPTTPNQLLSSILRSVQKKTVNVNETKVETKLTIIDIIKGVLFSISLILIYFIFVWLYGVLLAKVLE